jgi:glycosyltransferase involved in cell wall biosynthesis
MTISVIIPSRLEGNFLEGAVQSISSQAGVNGAEIQITVGIDCGARPAGIGGVEFVESAGRSQAAALNAAAARASGDYIAFLEDDDRWRPNFLKTALGALKDKAFVSSTQIETDERGTVRRINDFPTPSGWIMRRATFLAVGNFDETYRWHIDNEWLGRLGATWFPRAHLVESTAPVLPPLIYQVRPWLGHLLNFGRPQVELIRHADPVPLVCRCVHPGSGVERIARRPELSAQSQQEYARLMKRYGRIPW